MAGSDVILKFQIAEGRNPDAQTATEALAAWIDLLRVAANIVDPGTPIRVSLVGVEEGSQVFKFGLERAELFLQDINEGMKEYPLVSKALITLGGLITSTVLVVGVQNAMTPDPRIPPDQMAVFEESRDLMRESVELQKQQMRFYGILQDEPAYDRVDVLRPDHTIAYSIPRAEFAARSGLWEEEVADSPYKPESRTATWDVTLIKPVLMPIARRWRFVRDGIEFSAEMQDKNILQAIHDKTLPIQIAEGVTMKVEITYREVYTGAAWVPIAGSHKIKRVLHPLPPLSAGPLFSSHRP
tara:strand:+ start:570 stop:1463 length:894 start_codon:yes stop_codon:yes gene_type:complete